MLTEFLMINPCQEDSRGQRCKSSGTKVRGGTVGMPTQKGINPDGSVTAVPAVALRLLSEF